MRRWIALLLAIAFAGVALGSAWLLRREERDDRLRVAVCVYNASILSAIVQAAERDPTVNLLTVEDVRDQNRQIEEICALIGQNADVLIVNPIDRVAAIYLIDLAASAQIPIVIVNTEPRREDLMRYDRAYYVGSNAELTGYLCGQLIAECFLENEETDGNGDGVLQLVLFKGQTGHQDAEMRTKYSLKALSDAGVRYEVLSEEMAMWERATAQEKMSSCIAIYGDCIESVICNNDEMALGAIAALKAVGYFEGEKTIPVVGVDGISRSAARALTEGSLYGTVLNDTASQGEAAYRLARMLAQGVAPDEETLGYQIEEDHYVWIPSRILQ